MRAAEAAGAKVNTGPLADDELAALFGPLAGASLIALAVSGGADSLALLDSICRWRKKSGRPQVVVFTVDHRLRAGSAREAAMVRRLAEARGLEARILVRMGARPSGDVEAAARTARYRLLFDACREAGASHLVVAHHRDDVAETFLLRLKRRAGIFGLAAMRPAIPLGNVTLVRPFLGVPRARLAATTVAAGWEPVDDPMNSDTRYVRARVREMLAAGKLDPALLAATAERFADLAGTIDAAATALIGEAVATDAYAVAWLDGARFAAASGEVRARVLVRLLIAVGGADYPPRSERLSALCAAILGDNGTARFKRTLAGTVVERRCDRLAFYREAGRDGLPTNAVSSGFAGAWDHRFRVEVGEGAPAGLTLGPLGEEGRREIGAVREKLQGDVPHEAIAALPALRKGRKILAVPVLWPGGAAFPVAFRPILGERFLRPPLFPDFAGG